jgi:phenylpropionate dioxygenase-like ring-hydroxylating dioxygenase large terminal subunit
LPQSTTEQRFDHGPAARTAHRASLDSSRYTSKAFQASEWQGIWTRCWLFAGLESDLAEPGDYFVYEIGHESIIVIRDEDGEIHALFNVCQHRGNRLIANRTGAVRQLACPYHGWRYGLGGRLEEVPDAERFCPAVSPDDRSLKPVRVETWAGLVWINMDPEAPRLGEYLGCIVDNLSGYHFENMVLAAQQTVSIDANWKTVRDNFLEQYHVDFIHPQHASMVDCCNSQNILWPYGHSATVVEGYVTNSRYPLPEEVPQHLCELLQGLGMEPTDFQGRVPDIRLAVQQRKRQLAAELGFATADLADEQLSDVWQYDIFPNTFMTVQAEELWIYGPRPHPTDPDRCYFDKWTLQIPTEIGCDAERGLTLNPRLHVSGMAERPEHEQFTRDDILAGTHSLTITIDQDIQYLPDMQAGLHSRGFSSAVLNADELRLQHFHDWVDAWRQPTPSD